MFARFLLERAAENDRIRPETRPDGVRGAFRSQPFGSGGVEKVILRVAIDGRNEGSKADSDQAEGPRVILRRSSGSPVR